MRYCKARTVASLDNEFGFDDDYGVEKICMEFYATKDMIGLFANRVFAESNARNHINDECEGHVELCISDSVYDTYYSFDYRMLVNGRVMDGEPESGFLLNNKEVQGEIL